jgi:hypothetical protein
MPLFLEDPTTFAALQAQPRRQRLRKFVLPGPTPEPWMGPPFYDSFTSADGPLAVHTSESGHTWSAQPGGGSGTASIISNKAGSDAGGMNFISSFVPASPDYEVEAKMVPMSAIHNTSWAVVGRASLSANTYYAAFLYSFSGAFSVFLSRNIAGAYVEISHNDVIPQPTLGTTHSLKLRMNGSQISVYYDGYKVLGPFINTEITAAGTAGINSSTQATVSTGVLFDSVQATPIPAVLRPTVISQALTRAATI